MIRKMKDSYTDRFGHLVTVEDGLETYIDERGMYTLKKFCGNKNIVSVPEGIQSIFIDAFSRSKVEEVFLPDSVLEIGARSFQFCNGLESIIVPSSVKYIGEKAFNNCSNLRTVVFSGSLKYLGKNCFSGTMIESAYFPKGILSTLGPIYADCSHLKVAVIEEKEMTLNTGEFSKCDNLELVYYDGRFDNLPPLIRYKIEKKGAIRIKPLSEKKQ